MLDPYARAVARLALPEGVNLAAPRAPAGGLIAGLPPAQPVNAPALLGSLAPLAGQGLETLLDAGAGRPGTALEDSAVLELDVARFTDSVDVAPERHGKFLGVLDRCAASRVCGLLTFTCLTWLASSLEQAGSGAASSWACWTGANIRRHAHIYILGCVTFRV